MVGFKATSTLNFFHNNLIVKHGLYISYIKIINIMITTRGLAGAFSLLLFMGLWVFQGRNNSTLVELLTDSHQISIKVFSKYVIFKCEKFEHFPHFLISSSS